MKIGDEIYVHGYVDEIRKERRRMTSAEFTNLAPFIICYFMYSVAMRRLMSKAIRDDDIILQYILLGIYITVAVFIGWWLLSR